MLNLQEDKPKTNLSLSLSLSLSLNNNNNKNHVGEGSSGVFKEMPSLVNSKA